MSKTSKFNQGHHVKQHWVEKWARAYWSAREETDLYLPMESVALFRLQSLSKTVKLLVITCFSVFFLGLLILLRSGPNGVVVVLWSVSIAGLAVGPLSCLCIGLELKKAAGSPAQAFQNAIGEMEKEFPCLAWMDIADRDTQLTKIPWEIIECLLASKIEAEMADGAKKQTAEAGLRRRTDCVALFFQTPYDAIVERLRQLSQRQEA